MSDAGPSAPAERVEVIDVLRGAAMLGVHVSNAVSSFRVSLFARYLPAEPSVGIDHAVGAVVGVGVEAAPFALLSALFGLGLAAQLERISTGALVRRQLGLFVLGALHFVFVWSGDVLAFYALVGLVVALFLRLGTRALVAIGVACLVLQLVPLPYPAPFDSYEAIERHVTDATVFYGQARYRDALVFRLSEIRPSIVTLIAYLPRTVGLFFLGAAAWRARIHESRRRGGLGLALCAVGVAASLLAPHVPRRAENLVEIGIVALGLGYGVVLLAWSPRILVPVGRMALTSYLSASIVLVLLFHGSGLGLMGRIGEAAAAAIGVAIFAAQVFLCRWWLARHRLGPIERVLRSFTYGAWQPR